LSCGRFFQCWPLVENLSWNYFGVEGLGKVGLNQCLVKVIFPHLLYLNFPLHTAPLGLQNPQQVLPGAAMFPVSHYIELKLESWWRRGCVWQWVRLTHFCSPVCPTASQWQQLKARIVRKMLHMQYNTALDAYSTLWLYTGSILPPSASQSVQQHQLQGK
jgi:hypothetical protein